MGLFGFFDFMRALWDCFPNVVHILTYIVLGLFAIFGMFRIIRN